MSKYLDNNGLLYLWQKIKTLVSGKVDKVEGKGLSTNDYTSAEQLKLAGVEDNANNYTHPTHSASSTLGMKKIVVDGLGHVTQVSSVTKSDILALGITGEGDAVTYEPATSETDGLMSATDKSKLDAFSTADKYMLKSDATSLYKYKGSVSAVTNLPIGASVGDVYNVEDTGMNYAWTGSAWDALGSTVEIDVITNGEIDTIVAS